MSTRTLTVSLPGDSLYVSGTVNGTAVTWTNTEGTTWEAVAVRSADDVYRVELTIINSLGTANSASLTLYYGLHLVTDRTPADVHRAVQLNGKWVDHTWTGTTEELAEWSAGLKGAYNASDMNRVGAAMRYVRDRLAACGCDTIAISPKTDWTDAGEPTESQLARYLSDLSALRGALAVLDATPPVPETMEHLTYWEANDIEKILEDVDALITKLMQAWFYCGEIFAGEV